MQNLDSDLFNLDSLFTSRNDEGDDLWALPVISNVYDDDDLHDVAILEPLSPTKEEPHHEEEQVQVRQEPSNKIGLTIDTKLGNISKKGRLLQCDNKKANGSPISTLPARFALLSTTCVYEPGFTTSPRGKRRISQTHVAPRVDPQDEGEDGDADDDEGENDDGDEVGTVEGDDGEPFMLLRAEDYGLPVFTDAELSAMVESPLQISSTSTSSAALSSPHGLAHDETLLVNTILLDTTNTLSTSAGAGGAEYESFVSNTSTSTMYDSSQTFSEVQQHIFDPISSTLVPPCIPAQASQAMFAADPAQSVNAAPVMPVSADANPFDYFSPSGYAAAANQFLDNYSQHVQPFFLNPSVGLFQCQQSQTNAANVQLAAAMTMANSSVVDTMLKMNANFGVPIVPVQHQAGHMPPTSPMKAVAPLKVRLPAQRGASATSVSARNKGGRLAITPDIADFKLVQIFHEFCDPTTKVLTPPRFQQLVRHHQIKDESASQDDSAMNVTTDIQRLFRALDIEGVGSLDLERFMHSFQICNRCTEAKRRAHQVLCASQGQTFSPTALERQLMEDVAPVVVRVVPTRFEGSKVKSCEHYQWTWCEGFDKTGNEKCRGTNRHDKCPKYLANCTLWKHKLPPKSRKPRILLENVDSPTKKIKHFS